MYALKALAICENNLLKLVGMVPLARINLGNSYVLLEQYDEALAQFDQVAGIAALSGNAGIPMLTKVYNNKARVFERRKRYVEQKEQLLMAAKLLENSSEYNLEMGMILVNQGLAYLNNQQVDSAERVIRSGLNLLPVDKALPPVFTALHLLPQILKGRQINRSGCLCPLLRPYCTGSRQACGPCGDHPRRPPGLHPL
jgi:tetratricopeptide (TPR) repeat protein